MKFMTKRFLTILVVAKLFYCVSTAQILLTGADCEKSAQWLRTNCYLCPDTKNSSSCEVQNFGYLGEVENHFYFFAIYRDIEPLEDWEKSFHREGTFNNQIVMIFEGKVDSLHLVPIWQEGSQHDMIYFKSPQLFKTQFGYLLHIFESGGNGGWDSGHNFLRKNGKWISLETPNWNVELKSRLPKDYWLCRGSEIDFNTLTIKFNVYAPSDPCCCPKGGSISAHLIIRGNDILVDIAEYVAQQKN
jgi:hypothetical protein